MCKIVPQLQQNLQLGDIYYVQLPNSNNNAQYGVRPCVIAQNSYAIRNTNMVWVIPLTSRLKAMHMPVHVVIRKDEINGLKFDSVALLESMEYIPKEYLLGKIGRLSEEYFSMIGNASIEQFPFSKFALQLQTA